MLYIICYLLIVNIIAFFLMGIDKRKAQTGAWRIPERTLFLSAILGGGVGAIAGMQLFRHKSRHRSFVIGMPLILLAWVVLLAALIYFRYVRT